MSENTNHRPRPSVGEYIKTRFTTLIPTKEEINAELQHVNPFPPLSEMTGRDWQFFFIGFSAWTFDNFDYYMVSVNVGTLAESFNKSVKDITWAMTLVLMLRSIGAVIVGYTADKYGRKWPLIINLAILAVLQIGTGFVKTFEQFLGIRAIFGIVMGGMFGVAAATSLEGAPKRARSVLSGFFQQGGPFGYLLAAAFQRAFIHTAHTWKSLFWFSAGPPVLIIIWRLCLPETDAFLQQKLHMQSKNSSFTKDAGAAVKHHWIKLIYLVLLMAGFNFMSHGSQDLYPTLLSKRLQFSADAVTVTNCVANFGAIVGGILFGHFSGIIGRRFAIMICCVGGGAMIYPWAFLKGSSINAGAFFMQFFVQGSWGIIPIHLSELSPPEFRVFVSGVAYQLGNLASSASSTIESTIGERFPMPELGEGVYDYSKVMSIFMGCVFGYLLIVTVVGPENRNAEINLQLSQEDVEALYDQGVIDQFKQGTSKQADDEEIVGMTNDMGSFDEKFQYNHRE
ncbi:hypothetical protein WICPIJ_008472 [Wickerhamomyces pijperi]|uniref:Major facilitator superfamily (MFS) profile domain-containing protein n=1 Tax=Wickerhamomyces pijperi TaxID=599730 RepID=A0A9P8TIF4_WICPI|nr:hypothetical protein WICPIJ_008472 [Wickerhamomyces pijperi]